MNPSQISSINAMVTFLWLIKRVYFFFYSPGMTKTVNCLAMRTAQQIDTELMHRSEKFCQDLLVRFYLIKDFDFLIQEMKQRKILVWGLW